MYISYAYIVLILALNLRVHSSLSKSPHLKQNRVTHVRRSAFQGEVPVDISSVDKFTSSIGTGQDLIPDTTVVALAGADNLGGLLWTFVLYNGLYVIPIRPVDIVTPYIAKLLNETENQWFKDYEAGYTSQIPVKIDLVNYILFTTLGFATNTAVNTALGGDTFWGWSIGACLAIPSSLFTLARVRKISREEADVQKDLEEQFAVFAETKLRRVKGRKISEVRLIEAFRRYYAPARLEEDVSFPTLRKVVRKWVGYKPDRERIYSDIEFLALLQPKFTKNKNFTAARSKGLGKNSDIEGGVQEETRTLVSAGDDFIR